MGASFSPLICPSIASFIAKNESVKILLMVFECFHQFIDIPGESARIILSYEHHVSYPIDLYVLLDGSSSMTSYKGRISDATSEIVKGLNNITTNVQLGFGVFVDKPVLPYTDLNSWKYASLITLLNLFLTLGVRFMKNSLIRNYLKVRKEGFVSFCGPVTSTQSSPP